jgi:hypothetical protein
MIIIIIRIINIIIITMIIIIKTIIKKKLNGQPYTCDVGYERFLGFFFIYNIYLNRIFFIF